MPRKKSEGIENEEIMDTVAQRNTASAAVSALDKFFLMLKKYSIADYIRAFCVVLLCLVCYFTYKAASNEELMHVIAKKIEYNSKYEHQKMLARQQATPKIAYELENMLYRLNADRTFVIELHNGKENATYLPFLFYDMTYEEVNMKTKTERISQNFQNVNISNFKFPYYLESHILFIGNTDDIIKIDSNFGANFKKYGSKYGGFIFLKSSGKEIGFLGASFKEDRTCSDEEIREVLIEYAQTIAPLLDLEKQIKIE